MSSAFTTYQIQPWYSFGFPYTYWCFGYQCNWLNKPWHHSSYQITICRHSCISTSLYLSVKTQHIFELSTPCMPQSKVCWVMTENTLCCQAFVVCVVGLLQVHGGVDTDCQHSECHLKSKNLLSCEESCNIVKGALSGSLGSVSQKRFPCINAQCVERLWLCCSNCSHSDQAKCVHNSVRGQVMQERTCSSTGSNAAKCQSGYHFKLLHLSLE